MYAWIDTEEWDGAGRPALHEEHGYLWSDRPDHDCFGRLLGEQENAVVAVALVEFRFPQQPPLSDTGFGPSLWAY